MYIKLSVIVPVYNVEKYLRRCLDSCLSQDLPLEEYEVIVVNDGSPDNSLAIIKEYEQRYSNLVVIDKPNGGLSSARNAGLDIAKGEYVWFVDSDDSICDNCLSYIVDTLNRTCVSYAVINYNLYNELATQLNKEEPELKNESIYDGVQLFYKNFIFPYTGAPFYIFRRDFLAVCKLRFYEGIFYEDWLFSINLFSAHAKAVYIKKPCYNYILRSNSITKSKPSLKKASDLLTIAQQFLKHLELEDGNTKIYKIAYIKLIKNCYSHWVYLPSQDGYLFRKEYLSTYKQPLYSIVSTKQFKYLILHLLIILNIKIVFLLK